MALVAPELTWRSEHSPEVPAVARQADLVWEVERPDGQRGLLHVELQTRVEKDLGERVTEYAIRLWRRDHLPVRSMVIFLRPVESIPQSPFVIDWSGSEYLRYTFEVIKLWELSPERVLAISSYELFPLVTLMANPTVESVQVVAERIAAAPLPLEDRSELAALLTVLSGIRLRRHEVLVALRRNPMIDELLSASSIADEFRDEGRREDVRLILESRFGPVDSSLLSAIQQLEDQALKEVLILSISAPLDQIRAQVGLS